MIVDDQGRRLITGYVPKLALTYAGIVCYGILAVAFWARFFAHGRHKYMLTLCIGTSTMAVGFGIRVIMTDKPDQLGVYIATTLFTLLSPCAFLANDYIILPRLARWLEAEDQLFMRASRVTKTFIWSDVITFWLQAAGGGLSASQSEGMQKTGLYVALIGLIIQCVSFLLFLCLAIVFGYRIRGTPKWTNAPLNSQGYTVHLRKMEDWRIILYAVLWTGIGIMIRCVFRVIEYAEGFDGNLRNTEWAFYVFDALPLFLAIAVWVFVWPPAIMKDQNELFRTAATSPTQFPLTVRENS
ncbi:hypothetical protein I302_103617 [Kwoniella bestiolae CBS 10118]|uniref:RTA1 domain-containing protein n=1 Tax=Kwoniella bestiolae CBS 10118 TaxID=1296100 RepID=A0A1B9G8W5_9TREE|nr:hypothetical protein I302_02320 [Kwoniella bestiolae CBS 10118]OCF27478.1 hypothetical protein I302_02320 [Kwoniella bestiolae CBS 10118]